MSYKDLRIVFMGTPEFAVSSLKALVDHGCHIVGVITAPDKPKGRGKKLGISAVKEYALSEQLPLLQPTNLKDPAFIEELKSLQADLQVVVAFRMLPEIVWDMPPLGTFNLHASLLPDYRGAAPINWVIINGEKETGVTTFFLKHEIDTGSIIFQEKAAIGPEESVGELYVRLMEQGSGLVVKTVEAIAAGTVQAMEQTEPEIIKHAPKIFKENCKIDWNQPAENIRNLIRGLSPYPASWTVMHGKTLKVYRAELSNKKLPPGVFENEEHRTILVGTGEDALRLTDVQLEGKKRMKTEDLLRGYRWPDETE